MTVNMEWFGEEVLNAAKIVLKSVNKEVAEKVMADAKRILRQKAKTTTEKGLLGQFDLVQSKYNTTDFIVWCQGPRKWWPPYHASFLEMGTFKDDAKPFLRPAINKNKRWAKRKYQEAIE